MTESQAKKEAAKQSKSGSMAYVVWVFDEGRSVYSAEQTKLWAPLICIEAAFLNGVQISTETVPA